MFTRFSSGFCSFYYTTKHSSATLPHFECLVCLHVHALADRIERQNGKRERERERANHSPGRDQQPAGRRRLSLLSLPVALKLFSNGDRGGNSRCRGESRGRGMRAKEVKKSEEGVFCAYNPHNQHCRSLMAVSPTAATAESNIVCPGEGFSMLDCEEKEEAPRSTCNHLCSP